LEDQQTCKSMILNSKLNLTSLDISVYAHLREELVNTPGSAEVTYLKAHCPNLINFFCLMEILFTNSENKHEKNWYNSFAAHNYLSMQLSKESPIELISN
jgi:hypothetical protein